jgi:hypothetical protein
MPSAKLDNLLLIVGMHRSGTSALCAALQNVGVHFGSGLLKAIEGVNDEGFWEDADVVALNDNLLAKLGLAWFSLSGNALEVDWTAEQFDEQRSLATEILQRGFGGGVEAVKDPRFCLTLPFWLDCCARLERKMQVLCISRPPLEVAQSLEKRDGFPLSYGLRLAESYHRSLENHAPADACRLTFEQLLQDPKAALSELNLDDRLGLGAESITAVKIDLRHHRVADDNDILSQPLRSLDDVDKLRELLDRDYPLALALNELAQAYTARGAELSDVGDAHTAALATLDQRDADIEALSAEHKQTLTTIAERDEQIAEFDRRLVETGAELEAAMATIEERDEQIVEFDRRLSKLGEEHSHALRVIKERDEQIAQREAQLDRIRNIPGVGLVARRLLSNENS